MADLTQEQLERMYDAAKEYERHTRNELPHRLTTEQAYRQELGRALETAHAYGIDPKHSSDRGVDTFIATRLHEQKRPPEEIQTTIVGHSPKAAEFSTVPERHQYAKEVEREAYRHYTQEQHQRPERSKDQTPTAHTSDMARREAEFQQMQQHLDRGR